MSKVGRVRGCCFWLLGPRVTRPAAAASRWTSSRSAPSLRPTQHPYPLHKMDKTLISLINKVSKILTHPCLGTLGADQLIRSVSCLPLPASLARAPSLVPPLLVRPTSDRQLQDVFSSIGVQNPIVRVSLLLCERLRKLMHAEGWVCTMGVCCLLG